MVIKEIGCENFLSFKNFKLEINGVKRIQGENLDDDGQETNGTGKSGVHSIIEGILFNSTSRKGVTLKDLVRWGEKSSYLYMIMYCPIRKEELLIERVIGKGSKLDLTINSEPVDFATINDGNNQIINWIGISKEDLQNFFLINKERYNSFYSNSNTSKLAMIGRFSNLSIIDGSEDIVNLEIDKIRESIHKVNSLINNINGQNLQLQDFIEEEKNRNFSSEYNLKLDNYNKLIVNAEDDIKNNLNTIAQLRASVISCSNDISSLELEIDSYDKDISEIIIPNIDEELSKIKSKISKIEIKSKELSLQKKKHLDNLKQLNDEEDLCNKNLKGQVECPKCNHEFNPGDKDIDILEERGYLKQALKLKATTKDLINQNVELAKTYNEQINSLEISKSSMLNMVTSANKKKSVLERLKSNIVDKINSVESKVQRIDRNILSKQDSNELLKNKIIDIKSNIESLEIGTINLDSIAKREEKISENNFRIEDLKNDVDILNEELFQMSQWIHNFKMFRSNLSVDVLNVISGYTNKFLDSLKSDLQVKWEGFKVNSSGNLSDKITPQIIRNGELHPFGLFSGGERGRLEYANILTSQYLINSTHPHGGLQFLLTDEITEGIDALGLTNLAEALKEINIPILLITHVIDRSINNDVILIRKHKGVSKIVQYEDIRD
tara:strand:+ start:39084 stop:41087 length:2004 start_codon:yes stop_codon:yes gene_type:complete